MSAFKKKLNLFIFFFCFLSLNSYGKNLTVILDWFVNPDHAPLFVAKQQGYFKQEGLNVTFIPPAEIPDPPKLVAVGKADIGITYELQYRKQLAEHLPVKRIGTLVPIPLNSLVVLKSSPIHKISDLKGKKIGYSLTGSNHDLLKMMLKHGGLTLKDVHLINIHYNLSQALLVKKVDAIIGAMRNFEPIEMELVGKKVRLFYPEENGVPIYAELIFIVGHKNAHAKWIKPFLKAVQLGTIYLKNHPKKSWEIFAKNHPELNNRLNKLAWFKTIPYFNV